MALQSLDPWDDISVSEFRELADNYGTPFYLYDADSINTRIIQLRELMENKVKIFYAVKANPNLELLRAVHETTDGLDISSGGELEQAELAGFDAAKLSFAGPAKTTSELTASINKGIGFISIESIREMQECIAISKHTDNKPNILIRINPNFLNRSFGIKMGGKAVQFGIDEDDVKDAMKIIEANINHLNFKGIHIYAGSQCFDVLGIVEGVKNTFRIAREIESNTHLTCQTVNLGGGFGVSHTEKDREIDIKLLAKKLSPILEEFHNSTKLEREVIFELGRYLTANAGMYVAKVISDKKSRDKRFFMVDGGLHHHLAAAGTFGTALRSNFILLNLTHQDAQIIKCSIAGPSCNPTDLLGINVNLPEPVHGDLIGVLKSGSYSFTASPLLFLGHQTPAELIRHNGKINLARASKKITDFN